MISSIIRPIPRVAAGINAIGHTAPTASLPLDDLISRMDCGTRTPSPSSIARKRSCSASPTASSSTAKQLKLHSPEDDAASAEIKKSFNLIWLDHFVPDVWYTIPEVQTALKNSYAQLDPLLKELDSLAHILTTPTTSPEQALQALERKKFLHQNMWERVTQVDIPCLFQSHTSSPEDFCVRLGTTLSIVLSLEEQPTTQHLALQALAPLVCFFLVLFEKPDTAQTLIPYCDSEGTVYLLDTLRALKRVDLIDAWNLASLSTG